MPLLTSVGLLKDTMAAVHVFASPAGISRDGLVLADSYRLRMVAAHEFSSPTLTV